MKVPWGNKTPCFRPFFLAVVPLASFAQSVFPNEQAEKLLAADGNRTQLACRVTPIQPQLDFGFRFLAGYKYQISFSDYRGSGHGWTAITKVQGELGGPPVYFVDRVSLPTVVNPNTNGDAAGGFVVGEGRYRVSFQLNDDQARACRADWTIEAKLDADTRKVNVALKPGTIEEFSLRSLRSRDAQTNLSIGNMTVLLHAAPVSPRSSKIPSNDAMILLAALSSLMELAPARSVRLVVFSLDQRKEIYRQEHFTLRQLGRVRQALFNLQLATVDYRQLSQGPADLLQKLVTEELLSPDPAAAVVFLGPHSRSAENPALEIPLGHGSTPKFFYLEYQSPRRIQVPGATRDEFLGVGTSIAGQVQDAASKTVADGYGDGRFVVPKTAQPEERHRPFMSRDSIDYLVAKLKGKRFVVSTPVEFAKAMGGIAKMTRK